MPVPVDARGGSPPQRREQGTRHNGAVRIDARIPRAGYEKGGSSAQKLLALIHGIFAASPTDDLRESWQAFSEQHRALAVVWFAMAEHSNGTLHQYYSNSTGDMAPELPAAARRLGADVYADIFEKANALFGPGTLTDRRRRNEELHAFEEDGRLETLDRLSDQIYELEDAGDLIYTRITDYVEAHPADFFTDG
jgi:hypothetical protein